MLRRLLRWLVRTVVIVAALLIIALVSELVSHHYRPGSVITLELDGPLAERANASLLQMLNPQQVNALDDIRRTLRVASDDPRIVGLAIKVIDPTMELAQAQELSALITDFRAHGKWTTAYLETAGESGFGNLPYLVASAAQDVSLMPQGELNILGVGMREMFARGALDKLKITPNFDAIGQYKSAGNIFTQTDFTPAQRAEDDALAGDMYEQIVGGIARHRKLDPATVRALIDRAPLSAADGLQAHLVDRLEYEDQFDERVKHYRGEAHDLIDYASYGRPTLPWNRPRDRIAVVYGIGAIQRGPGGYDPLLSPGAEAMGSDEMVKAFDEVRKDPAIRAVIFRVDSPGGSVIASELIRRAVELTAREKPVVVSMSGYGASGGYWISTPAAAIIAEPGTITGSIGVLGGKFNIAGAAAQIGVNTDAVTRGANALMFDSFTDFTPAQAKIFHDQLLGETYNYFVKIVAQQRHMTVDQVNPIAQGRVWTGTQALKVKLVDQLGGFDAAVSAARARAKISPQTRVGFEELPGQPSLVSRLLSGQLGASATELHMLAPFAPALRLLHVALARHAAMGQAYCPLVPVL